MAAKKTRTNKRKRENTGFASHKRVRRTCKWCPKRGHNKTTSGNTHRFHGLGSFCATHKTTKRGRLYCKSNVKKGSRTRSGKIKTRRKR